MHEPAVAPEFDYSLVDVTQRGALRDNADRIRAIAGEAATGLWEMGRILADAQERLAAHGTGTFRRWVEREAGLNIRTAYRLIQVYGAFDRANLAQSNFGPSALYLLAAPSTPPEARSEALTRAEGGETVTHATAQRIVARHRPPPTPEYREFEREELMPHLHDAGLPDAPQILSGPDEEPEPVPEEEREEARLTLRALILEQLLACRGGADVDGCADEILETVGQFSGSIAVAARVGIALTLGPQTLADLTSLTMRTCGVHVNGQSRDEYLSWRRRCLRLLDALSYCGALSLYEHTLANGQICYGLRAGVNGG